MKPVLPNALLDAKKKIVYTLNAVPGKKVYGERLQKVEGAEYREWKPLHSKLAAALVKGMSIPLAENAIVLYLGASTGTTASHVSDIVTKGFVFALDSAPRVVRDLYFVCQARKNMAPLLADAALPAEYAETVPQVDLVYQDVAQKDQVRIFLTNVNQFLKKKGHGLLMVKARSIDFTKNQEEVFAAVRTELEKTVTLVAETTLEPYQKHHRAFLIKKQ